MNAWLAGMVGHVEKSSVLLLEDAEYLPEEIAWVHGHLSVVRARMPEMNSRDRGLEFLLAHVHRANVHEKPGEGHLADPVFHIYLQVLLHIERVVDQRRALVTA